MKKWIDYFIGLYFIYFILLHGWYVIFFVLTNIIGVKDNVADAIIGNVNFLRVGII